MRLLGWCVGALTVGVGMAMRTGISAKNEEWGRSKSASRHTRNKRMTTEAQQRKQKRTEPENRRKHKRTIPIPHRRPRVRRPRKPPLNIRRRDEHLVPERRARGRDLLHVLEGDAGGVAFAVRGGDDAFVAEGGLGGEGYGRALGGVIKVRNREEDEGEGEGEWGEGGRG